jgi:hypothetical protein
MGKLVNRLDSHYLESFTPPKKGRKRYHNFFSSHKGKLKIHWTEINDRRLQHTLENLHPGKSTCIPPEKEPIHNNFITTSEIINSSLHKRDYVELAEIYRELAKEVLHLRRREIEISEILSRRSHLPWD